MANYLMWRVVMEMVPELNDRYQQVVGLYKHAIQVGLATDVWLRDSLVCEC